MSPVVWGPLPWCRPDDVVHPDDHLSSLGSGDENLSLHLVGLCDAQLLHVSDTPSIHVCAVDGGASEDSIEKYFSNNKQVFKHIMRCTQQKKKR